MTQWGLDTLFNPAKRHMDEEKRRLQATRQQVGDTSGGKRIDLESGKVRIKAARGEDDAVVSDDAATEDATDAATDAAADAATDAATDAKNAAAKNAAAKNAAAKNAAATTPEPPKKQLTPAQIRAAERRRRKPS